MMQSKVSIVVAIMLIISFAAGFILRPIILPPSPAVSVDPVAAALTPPRATQYFAANLDEARRVVAGCRAGSMRGDECAKAEQAVTEAEGRDRFKKFIGH